MNLSIIVAMDKNRLIGNENSLPWNLPEDLRYFKQTTLGSPIIMGRKTFNSVGNKKLPNRENIILTRDKNFKAEGCIVINDISELNNRDDHGFVIGGTEIFKLLMSKVNKMYITEIDYSFEGDTYFPKFNLEHWELFSSEQGVKDIKNPYNYYFNVYNKKEG